MQTISKKIIFSVVLLIIATAIFIFVVRKPTKVSVVNNDIATTTPVYKVIGTSVEGRKIESYTYGTGAKSIVFVGGIHGGYEWNGVAVAYNLMDYLSQNSSIIPAGLKVTIIPDLNPDAVYKVTGKEGRFDIADVSTDQKILTSARFNSDEVDLNRNFGCNWKPKSLWQNKTVSGGSEAFSEPESKVFRDFTLENKPVGVIFWHSQSGGIYASECGKGILSTTTAMMNAYSKASGYPANTTFTAYTTTGASDDWLASIGVPAMTVEFKTHKDIEWDQNLAGVKAVLKYFGEIK